MTKRLPGWICFPDFLVLKGIWEVGSRQICRGIDWRRLFVASFLFWTSISSITRICFRYFFFVWIDESGERVDLGMSAMNFRSLGCLLLGVAWWVLVVKPAWLLDCPSWVECSLGPMIMFESMRVWAKKLRGAIQPLPSPGGLNGKDRRDSCFGFICSSFISCSLSTPHG